MVFLMRFSSAGARIINQSLTAQCMGTLSLGALNPQLLQTMTLPSSWVSSCWHIGHTVLGSLSNLYGTPYYCSWVVSSLTNLLVSAR